MALVLVVGDANPDLVLTGDVVPRFGQQEQLVDRADLLLGGSAAITACGVASLGVPVRLHAAVGDDVFGREVLAGLGAKGVDTAGVHVLTDRPTGLTVALVTGDDRAMLTLTGAIGAPGCHEVGDDELAQASHLHAASYFLQPHLAAALPDLLRRARAHGVRTSLDTNWDPAGAWAGLPELLPLVDVLLPNAAELRGIAAAAGLPSGDPGAAGRALAAQGTTVVLKDGVHGGHVWTPDGEWSAPALAVDAVDAVGAGDSFDAGWLAACALGLPPQEALRWAVGCGSLSVRAAGGTTAQPNRDELLAAIG